MYVKYMGDEYGAVYDAWIKVLLLSGEVVTCKEFKTGDAISTFKARLCKTVCVSTDFYKYYTTVDAACSMFGIKRRDLSCTGRPRIVARALNGKMESVTIRCDIDPQTALVTEEEL